MIFFKLAASLLMLLGVLLGAAGAVVVAAVLSVNDDELILDRDCDFGELNTVPSNSNAADRVAESSELVEAVKSDETDTVGTGNPQLLRL